MDTPSKLDSVGRPQRQDALSEQIATVLEVAVNLGCYDAADWIRDRWSEAVNRHLFGSGGS